MLCKHVYKSLKDKHGGPKETTLAILRKEEIRFRGYSYHYVVAHVMIAVIYMAHYVTAMQYYSDTC